MGQGVGGHRDAPRKVRDRADVDDATQRLGRANPSRIGRHEGIGARRGGREEVGRAQAGSPPGAAGARGQAFHSRASSA
ncbi:hypothetical protein AMK19_27290 [Kitasatospora sp. CB01950]|nr:hypothetical protein AMK19_27290 [Kitasatospora sp. CB01950]